MSPRPLRSREGSVQCARPFLGISSRASQQPHRPEPYKDGDVAPHHEPPFIAELAKTDEYDAAENQSRTPAHRGNPFKHHGAQTQEQKRRTNCQERQRYRRSLLESIDEGLTSLLRRQAPESEIDEAHSDEGGTSRHHREAANSPQSASRDLREPPH